MKEPPKTSTDLEKAARFLYLQRSSRSGEIVNNNFAVDKMRDRARVNTLRLEAAPDVIHVRPTGAMIERPPWRQFIEREGGCCFTLPALLEQ